MEVGKTYEINLDNSVVLSERMASALRLRLVSEGPMFLEGGVVETFYKGIWRGLPRAREISIAISSVRTFREWEGR